MAWAFWPAVAVCSRSASFGKETNGGAITISLAKFWPWSFERKLLTKSSVSEAPLFIFQLAAKIGLRFIGRWMWVMRGVASGFGEGGDTGQHLAFEQLEGCAATSGDESHFVIKTELVDGGDGVAAANDAHRTEGGGVGHGFGHRAGALGEVFDFKHAHRTV